MRSEPNAYEMAEFCLSSLSRRAKCHETCLQEQTNQTQADEEWQYDPRLPQLMQDVVPADLRND